MCYAMHINNKKTTLNLSCEITPMWCPWNTKFSSKPRHTRLKPQSSSKIPLYLDCNNIIYSSIHFHTFQVPRLVRLELDKYFFMTYTWTLIHCWVSIILATSFAITKKRLAPCTTFILELRTSCIAMTNLLQLPFVQIFLRLSFILKLKITHWFFWIYTVVTWLKRWKMVVNWNMFWGD